MRNAPVTTSLCIVAFVVIIALAATQLVAPQRVPSIRVGSSARLIPAAETLGTSTAASLCQSTGKYCRQALLQQINTDRAAKGLRPYALDWAQTAGTATCVGTKGHDLAMVASGTIWHTNAAYPSASFSQDIVKPFSIAGENVGSSSAPSKYAAMEQVYQLMVAEGPAGGHYQNLFSSTFTRIGIWLAGGNGQTYITEDVKA